MNDLVNLLKTPLTESELQHMVPEENSQEPDSYAILLNSFTQKNTEALVKCNINIIKFNLKDNNKKVIVIESTSS